MLRLTCAVLGLCAVLAPRVDVDAVTLARAFKAGDVAQFKNAKVTGTGMTFSGAISERIAEGSTRTSLVVILRSSAADGRISPVSSWDAFVDADPTMTTSDV